MSTRRAWQRFEVALTGQFLTGQPLQVRISDYAELQRTIGEALVAHPSAGWDYKGIQWRNVESYGSGGGYTHLVPLVLVRREGHELNSKLEATMGDRPDVERQWLRKITRGWRWRLQTLRLELYDLGVGVVTGVYEVAAPRRLSVRDTRAVVEAVGRLLADPDRGIRSPVAAAYESIARDTVTVFAEIVTRHAPEAAREPWLAPLLDAISPGDTDSMSTVSAAHSEWGRLLSLHPVFMFRAPSRADLATLQRIAQPFTPVFSRTIAYWDGLFTPGINTSVIVVRGRTLDTQGPPMRLTVLMWAYYGVFMELDRGLLALLDDDKWQTRASLAALELEAENVFSVYMRVQEARARLDSALVDLAGGQLAMWEAISEVQKFGELLQAVEGKVETLQRIAERRVQEAAAARARRTGNILSGLTALTVVTVAVALMGNFLGTPADAGYVQVRVITVAVAFLTALLLYRELRREIERKKARVRRNDGSRLMGELPLRPERLRILGQRATMSLRSRRARRSIGSGQPRTLPSRSLPEDH